MTNDELARVPDGGVIWRVGKDGIEGECEIIALAPDKDWYEDIHVYACGVFEDDARQIVGSVNAAILRNRFGWPSTKQPLDEGGKQIERDIDFWLDYAKGNA